MKIERLPDGYVRLTPDEGKMLYNINTDKYYSEAEVEEKWIKCFIEK